MANSKVDIDVPPGFNLRSTVFSHGWYDLPPFEWDSDSQRLYFASVFDGHPTDLAIEQNVDRVVVRFSKGASGKTVRAAVSKMLGTHLDLAEFYRLGGRSYGWAKRKGVGRFLRTTSMFEDAVKMLATTNCSWSLTKLIVSRLVEELGETAPSGRKAFPTPAAMAQQTENFYRDRIKAGYRSRYFQALAARTADQELDIESWPAFDGDTDLLAKEMRSELGFGPYVVENLLRLIGRYEGLGIDSWCRAKFQLLNGQVRGDVDKVIRKKYADFGKWQGLALWLDLTKDWHGRPDFGAEKF